MGGANLIPAGRREARRSRARRRGWVILCGAYGTVLLGGYAVCHAVWGTGGQGLDAQLNRTTASIRAADRQLAALTTKLDDAVRTWEANKAVGDQPDWSVLLRLVTKSLDDELVLSRCRLQPPEDPAKAKGRKSTPAANAAARLKRDGFVLKISGFARSQGAVSKFVLRLEQIDLFGQVKLMKTNREPFLAGKAVAFLVECSLGQKHGKQS